MKNRIFLLAACLGLGGVFSNASAQSAASAPPAVAPKPAEPAAAPAEKASKDTAKAAGDAMAGTAAWYGSKFNGRKTASGQRFSSSAMTAAHPSLPYGSRVKVTNTQNNRTAVVVINDRMPQSNRIIDVTQAAATKLGFIRAGTAEVKLELVGKS